MKEVAIKFSLATDSGSRFLPKHEVREPSPQPQVSRVARMLALAHCVEQKAESGEIQDYAHAAQILGLTRARMAQIIKLLYLSPTIQEWILSRDLHTYERQLRPVLHHPVWEEQEAMIGATE